MKYSSKTKLIKKFKYVKGKITFDKNVTHYLKSFPNKIFFNKLEYSKTDNLKYVGLHFGHDCGICIINSNGDVENYIEIERVIREKNTKSFISEKFNGIDYINNLTENNNIILCYSENENTLHKIIQKYNSYKNNYSNISHSLKETFPNLLDYYTVDHHIAHLFSSIMYRIDNNTQKPFLCIDGWGYDVHYNKLNSIFGEIDNLGIQIYDHNIVNDPMSLNSLLGYLSAGKLMGLAGYYPESKPEMLNFKEFPKPKYNETDYKKMAGFYKFKINEFKQIILQKLKNKNISNGIFVSGGVFLSLEINTWLHDNITKNISYCPATNDAGQALGAAAFAFYKHTGKIPNGITTPFIQDQFRENTNYTDISIEDIAKRIEKNEVFGIVKGKSEIGPRALGHRSIIASPKESWMYDKVSKKLKEREFYRPIAPIVTDKQFDTLFVGPKSKYMHYKVECTDICKKYLPAIVHVDGSSRPQVVYKTDNPWMYELLELVGKYTGFEILINTSLNKKAPICMSYDDALYDFKNNLNDITLLNIKD